MKKLLELNPTAFGMQPGVRLNVKILLGIRLGSRMCMFGLTYEVFAEGLKLPKLNG